MQNHKAFSILELLVVITIIAIISVFGYPKVNNWLADREAKKEAQLFITEINELKGKVTSGQYSMAMIHFSTPNFQYATMKKYYMSKEDYAYNYRGDTFVSGNNHGTCDYDPRNMRYQFLGTYQNTSIRHWPNIHMCISQDGKRGVLNQTNPNTGERRSLSRVIFCLVSNSSTNGSTRCNDTNKIENRYMVTWNSSVELTMYRYNSKNDKWCPANAACRSLNEFN